MTTRTFQPPNADPRRAQILEAAFSAFCLYGFRRTSMEDIARAAGMSRAALYLHFRNKEDVYRSLAQHYYDLTATRMAEVLRPGQPVEATLAAAFMAKSGPELEAMMGSPHGAELLDVKHAISADITTRGEAHLTGLLAAWLQTEADAGRLHLPPDTDPAALAATMNAAAYGLKSPPASFAQYVAGLRRLAMVMGRGLRA